MNLQIRPLFQSLHVQFSVLSNVPCLPPLVNYYHSLLGPPKWDPLPCWIEVLLADYLPCWAV